MDNDVYLLSEGESLVVFRPSSVTDFRALTPGTARSDGVTKEMVRPPTRSGSRPTSQDSANSELYSCSIRLLLFFFLFSSH